MKTAIFILAGILGVIFLCLIIKFVLWIKGGAAASLTKKIHS
jgi:hypothetical protein